MSDDVLRKAFAEQLKRPPAGRARAVKVEGGVVLHPDDRAQMTRLPEHRDRRRPR